jgi:hypothetical protein
MALEAGTYISDLVVTNPTGTDNRREGDDHLRLLKSTLKNTFPNVTGPITVTQAELNHLAGVASNIQIQLNAKEPIINSSNKVPAAYVGSGFVSDTEFNYLNGVTSNIQTQLNTKATLSPAGEIGTYAFLLKGVISSGINPNDIVAGSSLAYSGLLNPVLTGDPVVSAGFGTNPPGSWRAMGYCAAVSGKYPVTLWQRYS